MAPEWVLESREWTRRTQTVLASLPFRVGRAAGLELVLSATSVSSEHAEFVRKGEELWVRDLGSVNGTFVNNARIRESRLRHGDIIRFGGAEFRITGPPVVLKVYRQGKLVGYVELERLLTRKSVPASPWSPAAFKNAAVTGRWLRLADASADAFALAAEEGTPLDVLVDGVDEVGVELFRSYVGRLSLVREGEALLVLPAVLKISWRGNFVGHVDDASVETIEFVAASASSPSVVRSAKLRGRWVSLADASADAFTRTVKEGAQPEVVVDGVDDVGVGLFQSRVGLFSLVEEDGALLYFRP